MMKGLSAWQNRGAFEYTEQLDGPLLAWEYLRRNRAYRTAWDERNPVESETAERDWGLLRLIDPMVDARSANPIWQPDPPSTLRVVRASAAKEGLKLYDLQIERTPYMVCDDQGTYCTASMKSKSWRVHVADGLADDDRIAIAIPVDEFARRRVAAADRFIVDLKAEVRWFPEEPPGDEPSRSIPFLCSAGNRWRCRRRYAPTDRSGYLRSTSRQRIVDP